MAENAIFLGIGVVAAVLLLLFLVIRVRLHAFVALLLVSVLLGLAVQWPHPNPQAVIESMQRGMGGTLGFVAIVVGLGSMFGQLLEFSGAASVLADGLLSRFGQHRAPLVLGVVGFLVSIPVFFDVGFVILVPIVYGLSRTTRLPLMRFALPLMAGMVVTHAFVPPTPGPIGVAAILGAQLGHVISVGLCAGSVAMLLAGPLLVRLVERRVPGNIPGEADTAIGVENLHVAAERRAPVKPISLSMVLGLIALPLLLMVLGSFVPASDPQGATAIETAVMGTLRLLGHPFIALLLCTLVAFWLLGTARGLSRGEVSELATRSLQPAGIIILITGAGGVLKQVMVDAKAGQLIAESIDAWGVSPIVLAFALAWIVRVMQGSATVAMLTAAGLVVAVIEPMQPSPALRALLVIAIASGATCTSHVNDSGFWLVSRYLGLSVSETLRSWTLMTTVVGLTGFGVTLLLSQFIR